MASLGMSFRFFLVLSALLFIQSVFLQPVFAEPADPKLSNDRCLRCHGREAFSREDVYGRERDLHVMAESFIGQFPVAAEGFSVKGFEQSEQNRHGTFAVFHRFTSCWQVAPTRQDTAHSGPLISLGGHKPEFPCYCNEAGGETPNLV